MKTLKFLLTLIVSFQFLLGFSQGYNFVPDEFIQLSEEQLQSMTITIGADVLLFDTEGKRLSNNQISLMTNPEYRPVFYSDANGKIKAVVFESKNEQPILIEENPEAQFDKGEYALDFMAFDMNNNRIKLSELRGKVIVLNFWFIRCSPCIKEMPDLNEVASMYSPEDVVFLGITFDAKEMVEQFLDRIEYNYNIAPDANDAIKIYGVSSFPTNMIINQQGQIVFKEIGYRTNIKEVLISAINKLL